MPPLILPFTSSDATLALAGGKGANLVRLARHGFPVPGGFIVSTVAYQQFVAENALDATINAALVGLRVDDPAALEAASVKVRAAFEAGALAPALDAALQNAYTALGAPPVAVRSSATAEDLPELSFAGQQDTYLNVQGGAALRDAVRRCWGSLWTGRAIGYRARNALDHAQIALAVVVQAMVPSQASGVLFTANPLTGLRTETVIDATLGLGEALVSGQVEPDHYVVDTARNVLVRKTLGAKALAIHGTAGGGVQTSAQDAAHTQALPDAQILALAQLGARVAEHYSFPQDIEWGWADGTLSLLQARPITSLFPVPAGLTPDPLHVMVSFGSVQGVLDPLTPLGQDALRTLMVGGARMFGFQLAITQQQVFLLAGERLWIDFSAILRNPIGRRVAGRLLPFIDPGAAQVLPALLAEPSLRAGGHPSPGTALRLARFFLPVFGRVLWYAPRPDALRARFDARVEKALAQVAEDSPAGVKRTAADAAADLPAALAAFDTLSNAVGEIFPYFLPAMMTAMGSLALLGRLARGLPGHSAEQSDGIALALTRGLPYNVTTEMDLVLWETAQAIHADAESQRAFQTQSAEDLGAAYLAGKLPLAAQMALAHFMARYGMRGLAEIDFGRARWRETPATTIHTLQGYLQIGPDQAPDAMFARGALAAEAAFNELVTALRATRFGALKAALARVAFRRYRALGGVRETPKFTLIRWMGAVRVRLLAVGAALVAAGRLAQADDVVCLTHAELSALGRGEQRDWQALVAERRAVLAREQRRRQIPRLLLSDGRAFYEGVGAAADDAVGTLSGSPVSPGVVEGVVHVVHDPHSARLAPGEILVCRGTDPAWTPLFLSAGGLVMEVGGMMTHGSVVAREYGIPAVVGVSDATTRLQSGERIRVDGTTGRIVRLSASA